MADKRGLQDSWTQVQDSRSPLVSLDRKEQRNKDGAHTHSSLISHVGMI